mmetsp:Transcript_46281/g.107654  ORF Transcript_46281/g.107654 Transcript_46281/m.107654 type:complete len:1035 (+) Transcript_46281:59-3163(+)
MDGMEEQFDRAVRLVHEGARLEQEAMELDNMGDGSGAVEYYRRAAVKLSQAVAAAGDHHRDWLCRATIRAHIMQVDARISYLDSLHGAAALIPLEEHIKRVELSMGPEVIPGHMLEEEWEVLEGSSARLFDVTWEGTGVKKLDPTAWISRFVVELGHNAADKVEELDKKYNLSGKARLASIQTQQALGSFCERHKVAETLDQGLTQASAIVANLLGDVEELDTLDEHQRMLHANVVVSAEEDTNGSNTGWFIVDDAEDAPSSIDAARQEPVVHKDTISPLLGTGICFGGLSPSSQSDSTGPLNAPLQEERLDAFSLEADLDDVYPFPELHMLEGMDAGSVDENTDTEQLSQPEPEVATEVYQFILLFAFRQGRASHVEYFMRISKLVLLTLWFNHVGACLWRGVALDENLFHDTGEGWTDDVDGHPNGFLYAIGFYWSTAALFSGASMTIPKNSREVLISVCFIIFGVMFASSLISTLAALLIDVHMTERENTEQMRTLRRFLKQHKISLTLSISIQKQVFERMSVEPRLSDQDVKVLNLLSASMRAELRHALCDSLLLTQDLLRAVSDVDAYFIHDLLKSEAIQMQALVPGQEIFSHGQICLSAHIVAWGDLRYSAFTKTIFQQGVQVKQQNWICEVALWAEWTTQGLLEATTACELITLQAIELSRAVRKDLALMMLFRDVSTQYCCVAKDLRIELGDLQTFSMDVVMFALPYESRNTLSFAAHTNLTTWRTLALPHGFTKFSEEEEKGLCMLRPDGGGWTLKVHQVVLLRLERDDSTTFVMLYHNPRDTNPVAQLPSITVTPGELPSEALQRVIQRDLPELVDSLQIERTAVHTHFSQSWHVNKVRIKTVRIEFFAQMASGQLSPRAIASEAMRTPSTASFMDSGAVAEFLEGSSTPGKAKAMMRKTSAELQAELARPPIAARLESPSEPRFHVPGTRYGWIAKPLLERLEESSARRRVLLQNSSSSAEAGIDSERPPHSFRAASINEEPGEHDDNDEERHEVTSPASADVALRHERGSNGTEDFDNLFDV